MCYCGDVELAGLRADLVMPRRPTNRCQKRHVHQSQILFPNGMNGPHRSLLGLVAGRQPPRFLVVLAAAHLRVRECRSFACESTARTSVLEWPNGGDYDLHCGSRRPSRRGYGDILRTAKSIISPRTTADEATTNDSVGSRLERNRKSCTQYLVKVVSVNILRPARLAAMKGDLVG
jgi:hypothetical protein